MTHHTTTTPTHDTTALAEAEFVKVNEATEPAVLGAVAHIVPGTVTIESLANLSPASLIYHSVSETKRGELVDVLAVDVCQMGGHIPNRDRSLPGSCNFHRATAARHVDVILDALTTRPATPEVI